MQANSRKFNQGGCLDRLVPHNWYRMKKITVIDIFLAIIAISAMIVASPYVFRQMAELTKFWDYFWNISLDVLILTVFFLVIYVVDRLLNRFL